MNNINERLLKSTETLSELLAGRYIGSRVTVALHEAQDVIADAKRTADATTSLLVRTQGAYNKRRTLDDSKPFGYLESDNDYLLNNSMLAVSLLDNYGGAAPNAPEATTSQPDAITAMCLWEVAAKDAIFHEWLEEKCPMGGIADHRQFILELVPLCEAAYAHAVRLGYDDSFDWEFCPLFLTFYAADSTLTPEQLAVEIYSVSKIPEDAAPCKDI